MSSAAGSATAARPRVCKVCSHPQEGRITAALLARLGLKDISRHYPGIGSYSLKEHERGCLARVLRGGGVRT